MNTTPENNDARRIGFKALYSSGFEVTATHPLKASQTFYTRNKTEAVKLKHELLADDWETVTLEAL